MVKSGIGKGATIGFTLAILALLVSGWLSYSNIRRIDRNDAMVVHTHEVLDELRDTFLGWPKRNPLSAAISLREIKAISSPKKRRRAARG